jgi:formylglycine-generating enzyme required for sulfatase activity
VWWTGNRKESLDGAVNIADSAAKRFGESWPALEDWPELDDGYVAHAPVGTYRANPFGLHDVCGNVWEWCRENFDSRAYRRGIKGFDGEHDVVSVSLRVARGGSFGTTARNVRSAARGKRNPGVLVGTIGVRPVKRLDVRDR